MSVETSAADVAAAIAAQRAVVAAAQARLADLAVEYADLRTDQDRHEFGGQPLGSADARPGEFVADELSLILGEQSWDVRLLLARTRRIRGGLPEVQRAARQGHLDAERVRLIDKAAKLCTEPHTIAVLADEVVEAARSRTPKQLKSWLDRFLATHEPDAFNSRHRRAFADRRVTTSRSSTGMGYVTGEVSAVDAFDIDLRLTSLARACGAADPRSEQQRRSDIFAALLRGDRFEEEADVEGIEVEIIDPETGEYFGTRWEPAAGDSSEAEATSAPAAADRPGDRAASASGRDSASTRPSAPPRIGIVVPLTSLFGLDDRPAELGDRSGCVPAELARDIARQPGTLFYRLLTDERGRLLDVTELGRFASDPLAAAIRFRTGCCAFPTCTKPAELCDIDHHEPVPRGPTAGWNADPGCRRHHRGKTFAGLACRREDDAVVWTLPTAEQYRCLDEPFPIPRYQTVDFLDALECPEDDVGEESESSDADADLAEILQVVAA